MTTDPQALQVKNALLRASLRLTARALKAYLAAAVRQPQLFCRTAATIIRHIHCIIDMQRQGLLAFPGQEDAPAGQPLLPLFAFLVKNPSYMTLADDNYALR